MKEMYKRYKREILIGVVVSLITAVIIKIGDWLLNIIPSVGNSIFDVFSNFMYSLAATCSDYFILNILLFGGIGIFFGFLLAPLIKGGKLLKMVSQLELKSKIYSFEKETTKMQNQEDMLTKVENEKNNDTENCNEKKELRKYAIIILSLIVFVNVFVSFFIFSPMMLSSQFDQDIIKITPYVEECEVNQLKSDWACMRSKENYDDIYDRINEIKEKHALP